jgi:2-iminobutanoate/2-iminopropanoate deaminase
MINRHNYSELGPVVGPYSHSVTHNNVLYTSGLTAFGSQAQGKSIDVQAREIFSQLNIICEANQTSLAHLIKVTLFVSDMTDISLLRDTLFEIYGKHLPASALIKVNALFSDEINIEVEAMIGCL